MRRLGTVVLASALSAMLLGGCAKTTSSRQTATTASDTSPLGLGDAAAGSKIFVANCSSCHGAAGAGGGIGPALTGEKTRKDLPAAIAWIKNPQPPMPALFPGTLSEADVENVAAYVETL